MTERHRPLPPSDDPVDFLPDPLEESTPTFHANGVPPMEEGLDPFDPERLRISPDTSSAFELKRPLLTVPVRRPAPHWFFRTHRDNRYHLLTLVLELKEEREIYLVDPCMWDAVVGLPCIQTRILTACMNRQQKFFFWPIRPPAKDGRRNEWTTSAIEAARIAKDQWIRLESDMTLGAYEVAYAEHLTGEPAWPDVELNVLLRIAFKERHITRPDHTILQQLRGRD
jgi:hypothetical protein